MTPPELIQDLRDRGKAAAILLEQSGEIEAAISMLGVVDACQSARLAMKTEVVGKRKV